jgi:methyl-accepting chemotaxis protein
MRNYNENMVTKMTWINRSIRNKLMAIIGIGALSIVLASIASFSSALSGMQGFESLVEKDVANERLITKMLVDFKTQVQEWKNTLLRGEDSEQRTKYWQRFQDREQDIQDEGRELLSHLEQGEAATLVSRFLDAHKSMGSAYRQGFDAFEAQGYDHRAGDKAVKGIDREPAKLLSEAAGKIAEMVKLRSEEAAAKAYSGLTVFNTVLGVVIVLFALASIWVINKAIVAPSQELIGVISRISSGKINNEIHIQRDDELGKLADASRHLQSFLQELAHRLNSTDEDLKGVSQHLAESSEALVNKVSTANESTDHIASAMTEMSATAQEVAGHAASAANLAQEADEAAKDGVQTMGSAQESINRLATQISDTVEVVKRLEEDTNNVGTVLSVIRGIAEQTNLLALNAAIEAARAGEQGRGFAVVADEVRSLAQKTQQSTTEIEDIIESVQSGAKNTAEVMNASSEVTANSADMFNQASEKLDVISSSISQINGLNMQVATAAEEQTNVSEDIARTVVEMSDLVEATAQSANQSLEMSQQLSNAATNLEELSATFRT